MNYTEKIERQYTITKDILEKYAEVSGDRNKLHLDDDFASKTRFKARIAHGMLLVALVTQMLEDLYVDYWLNSGILEVKFISPIKINEVLIIQAEPIETKECNEKDKIVLFIDIKGVTNQEQLILSAHAKIKVPISFAIK